MESTILNGFVVGALLFFVAALAGLLWVLITQLVPQITRTLTAYERLAGTLEEELTPTLREVSKVVGGVNELKSIAVKNVSEVSTKVEDVTGSISKATHSATKHSSIWSAGLLAAAKTYLEGN